MVDKCLPYTETAENVSNDVISTGGWIIGAVSAGVFSVNAKPKVHTSAGSVNSEMERLAKQYPTRIFVKLKVEGMVVASGVKWF
jgi:hypothetical protein